MKRAYGAVLVFLTAALSVARADEADFGRGVATSIELAKRSVGRQRSNAAREPWSYDSPRYLDSACDVVDTFPEAEDRDQGSVGSCHDFATIGAVESAFDRQYGGHIALSEADLFIQNTIENNGFFEGLLRRAMELGSITVADASEFEGNNVDSDFAAVQSWGVASRRTVDYQGIMLDPATFPNDSRYKAFQERLVEAINGSVRGVMPPLLYELDRNSPEASAARELSLEAGGDARVMARIRQERETTRRFAEKFTLVWPDLPESAGDMHSQQKIAVQTREWILQQLDYHRPVLYSYDDSSLSPIGAVAPDGHALLITGYKHDMGDLWLSVRDSHGKGSEKWMREKDLKAISDLRAIAAPGDKPGWCSKPAP